MFSGSATKTQTDVIFVLNKPNVSLFSAFVKVAVCEVDVLFGTKEFIGVLLVTPSAVTSKINCDIVTLYSLAPSQLKLTTRLSPDQVAVTFDGSVGTIIKGPDPPGYV